MLHSFLLNYFNQFDFSFCIHFGYLQYFLCARNASICPVFPLLFLTYLLHLKGALFLYLLISPLLCHYAILIIFKICKSSVVSRALLRSLSHVILVRILKSRRCLPPAFHDGNSHTQKRRQPFPESLHPPAAFYQHLPALASSLFLRPLSFIHRSFLFLMRFTAADVGTLPPDTSAGHLFWSLSFLFCSV